MNEYQANAIGMANLERQDQREERAEQLRNQAYRDANPLQQAPRPNPTITPAITPHALPPVLRGAAKKSANSLAKIDASITNTQGRINELEIARLERSLPKSLSRLQKQLDSFDTIVLKEEFTLTSINQAIHTLTKKKETLQASKTLERQTIPTLFAKLSVNLQRLYPLAIIETERTLQYDLFCLDFILKKENLDLLNQKKQEKKALFEVSRAELHPFTASEHADLRSVIKQTKDLRLLINKQPRTIDRTSKNTTKNGQARPLKSQPRGQPKKTGKGAITDAKRKRSKGKAGV